MGSVFDLDGTLVDSTPDLLAAINAVFHRYNLPLSNHQENLSLAGDGLDAMFNRTLERRVPSWKAEKKEQLKAEMLFLYREEPAKLTLPFPGILSLLEAIQAQGIPIGIISNKLGALTQKILHVTFPSVTFARVYGIDSGFEPKPDQGSLLDFKGSLSFGEELIYVGDTEIDYKTARGVADRIYLATWGYRGSEGLLEHGIDKRLMVSDTAQLACALNIRIS
jgi:phosphoglycolate phosphatase